MATPNRAPRWITIIVSLVLIAVGVLGTFAELLPEVVGVVALVTATVLMLLGVLFRGL
ncbi:MAG: hypothetical protein QOG87_959 [Actinomycetota bacterium]